MTPDSLKQLASPFRRIVMCGSHRSGSLASLLAQPDAKKAIKIYPARFCEVMAASNDAHRMPQPVFPRITLHFGDRCACGSAKNGP